MTRKGGSGLGRGAETTGEVALVKWFLFKKSAHRTSCRDLRGSPLRKFRVLSVISWFQLP